jgi:hypothetical protein
VPLDARAFDVDVPADFTAITLEELRTLGPLGGGSTGQRLRPAQGERPHED